jgi:hypothetical protein
LYTGLAAAKTTESHLSNAADALPDYARAIADIRHAYAEQFAFWYGAEMRWRDHPFWRSRLKVAHENARVPQASHL